MFILFTLYIKARRNLTTCSLLSGYLCDRYIASKGRALRGEAQPKRKDFTLFVSFMRQKNEVLLQKEEEVFGTELLAKFWEHFSLRG